MREKLVFLEDNWPELWLRKSQKHSTFVIMAISTNSIIRCDIMYQLHLESVIWQVCGCQKKRDDNTTIMFTCTLGPNPFLSPIEGTNSNMTDSKCKWYMFLHLIIKLVLIAISTKVEWFLLFLESFFGSIIFQKNKRLN